MAANTGTRIDIDISSLNVESSFYTLRFYLAARGPAASLLQVLLVVLRELGVVRLLVARRACAARRAGLASGASAVSNGRGSGRKKASGRQHSRLRRVGLRVAVHGRRGRAGRRVVASRAGTARAELRGVDFRHERVTCRHKARCQQQFCTCTQLGGTRQMPACRGGRR